MEQKKSFEINRKCPTHVWLKFQIAACLDARVSVFENENSLRNNSNKSKCRKFFYKYKKQNQVKKE